MTDSKDQPLSPEGVGNLPHLAEALDDHRFRHFLDHVPFAVAVSELGDNEALIYVNLEFERLTAAGVSFKTPPTTDPFGTSAVFDDGCGNYIQIHQD